jgi:hypothetical protein
MATSGLYGNTAASVVALPSGSETSGLYGNNTVFGGTYFEWFVFQDAATQPSTPTGGSWSFTTNTGTPPTGWSNNPPANPTYKVWVSIALVNSKSSATYTWSTPGVMASTAAGTVTSVGLSAPSFLSVSGSPVTTSGTLALSYSGTALPVANGGTGTTTPNLVAGTNVSITGTWPNQTINSTNSGGTVTSVTATSPVLSSGGTTPVISLPAATSSVSGYLTSTDWNTFNNKGSVTSVAATVPSFLSVSGSPITSNGTLAISYSGTALPVANGGTGVTSSSGANSVVLRDANQNINANSISEGYSNVAAAGTTTVLTASSVPNYVVTGSGGQTYQLPNATTLPSGVNYTFNNNQSSGTIVVKNNSSTTIATIQSGGFVDVSLLSNATAAGSWDVHNFAPSNVSWSTNTFDYAGSITSATWNGATVAYNRGGTGQSSAFVAGGVVYGSTTSAMAVTAAGTSGQILTSAGAGAPTFSSNIDGVAIGSTTPAAGSFTTLIGGAGSANYEQITGGTTTKAVQFQTLGTDTNISVAVQPKGTGAIDLAAGSSGVNISNGGTVTALTITALGATTYTGIPTATISVPTTAGGVQATANVFMGTVTGGVTVAGGGTGYTLNDVLTLVGGTSTVSAQLIASSVSAGVITGVTVSVAGNYSVLPSNPVSVTGGTGSGATFTVLWRLNTLTVGTAGSGYVEQPTVTFSGGGGSGAAAYATVGSGVNFRTLGGSVSFVTPGGEQMRVNDSGATSTGYLNVLGSTASSGGVYLTSATNAMYLSASGGTNIQFFTNGQGNTRQFYIAHTASAVNYVQVTGSATGGAPVVMSAQGSDTNVNFTLRPKGTGSYVGFASAGGAGILLGLPNGSANYFTVASSNAGSAPILASAGTDGNIDLTLTPKGTGRVNITTSIKPKVNSAASVTSPLAWDSTSYDEYAITALANALTINADANASPADGQKMMFRFKDNGTARALTWTTGSTNSFRVVGVTLPTTTVISKLVYIGCIYNAADSRWDVVAVSQEA